MERTDSQPADIEHALPPTNYYGHPEPCQVTITEGGPAYGYWIENDGRVVMFKREPGGPVEVFTRG